MEAGDGIGLRLSRLQAHNTCFHRVIKTTRHVSKTTPKPQIGVRFGVRLGYPSTIEMEIPQNHREEFQYGGQEEGLVEVF
jgi:hypothetical protein